MKRLLAAGPEKYRLNTILTNKGFTPDNSLSPNITWTRGGVSISRSRNATDLTLTLSRNGILIGTYNISIRDTSNRMSEISRFESDFEDIYSELLVKEQMTNDINNGVFKQDWDYVNNKPEENKESSPAVKKMLDAIENKTFDENWDYENDKPLEREQVDPEVQKNLDELYKKFYPGL